MTTTGKIVIVGGGVTGLTTAVALLEAGLSVRLVAAEIPGPTSVAAGAMWGPYLVEPWSKVRRWSLVSLDVFRGLSADPATGVRMVSGVEAARDAMPAPEWSTLLPDFRECSPGELPSGFGGGYRFTVPLIDMPAYLQYLLQRFRTAGGTTRRQFVTSLDEIDDASVIVNCAGLGAGDLATDDGVRPIRGQLVVVKNPGITEFFSEDTGLSPDLLCIYPHGEIVVLGGTAIDGETSLQDDPVATRAIIERCATVDPRLAKAPVIASRIGARPTRSEVRVEADSRSDGVRVFHNYGHGGAGVTLSWGCAREVVHLVTG
ncbi:FAD-dependent oxidoreductase [Streptomyces violaceochromogenes]|uniref:D-amino-acid oxidase n=1 Tax=Streptomyces violaceochromogenes TaxID=67377 RepID=A0ABU6M1X4_9ACTN|nr:FAD-dependent oxidoreductase [Streptomyces violaceochromogenes]MEC7055623.1 FAD-dependent oxidoreductase [Streptomyces violaceochromogenes]GHC74182.1 amino acid oxidase [Streptomyces violaceochromogenes]